MSSKFAIRAESLSKCYQIYDQPRDRLKQFVYPRLTRIAGLPPRQYFREFWALRDITFEVERGETVGIIGRNGSGKSTLLQIICGTLNPTGGRIETSGRIAALLELGSGFNPEFTGRENVYMNGAVLGLSKEEIDARFDAIAEFADIGDFIEQPIKTYSSGMLVRLAFSVSINVDPDIFIIDEALSVGDELFQRKCFSRIEAMRAAGATILFVSHSGSQVVELCDRAILLDSGEKLAAGYPKTIVSQYQRLLYAPQESRDAIRDQLRSAGNDGEDLVSETDGASVPPGLVKAVVEMDEVYDPNLRSQSTIEYESQGVFIEAPRILTETGEPVNCLVSGRIYRYEYMVQFRRGANNVRFGMLIKTTSGVELGGGASAPSTRDSLPFVRSGTECRVQFKFRCSLNAGVYFLNAGVVGEVGGAETYLHRLIDVAMFKVLPDIEKSASGIVDFGCHPTVEFVG
jgi:lipopolysaccharide transport system ATP-binding protein